MIYIDDAVLALAEAGYSVVDTATIISLGPEAIKRALDKGGNSFEGVAGNTGKVYASTASERA